MRLAQIFSQRRMEVRTFPFTTSTSSSNTTTTHLSAPHPPQQHSRILFITRYLSATTLQASLTSLQPARINIWPWPESRESPSLFARTHRPPSPRLPRCMPSLADIHIRDVGWQAEGEVDCSLFHDVSRVRGEFRAVFPFCPSGCQRQGQGAREGQIPGAGVAEYQACC